MSWHEATALLTEWRDDRRAFAIRVVDRDGDVWADVAPSRLRDSTFDQARVRLTTRSAFDLEIPRATVHGTTVNHNTVMFHGGGPTDTYITAFPAKGLLTRLRVR